MIVSSIYWIQARKGNEKLMIWRARGFVITLSNRFAMFLYHSNMTNIKSKNTIWMTIKHYKDETDDSISK